MKAVVCTTLGEPNLLEIKDNPIPEPQKNEVLIKVEAAGVNFPDALMVVFQLTTSCATNLWAMAHNSPSVVAH